MYSIGGNIEHNANIHTEIGHSFIICPILLLFLDT